MSLYREFFILKELERERALWAGQQSVIFKVRIGLEEIEGRDRETERQRASPISNIPLKII
jgi:hypothetical protein